MKRFYCLVIFLCTLCGFVTLTSIGANAQQAYYPTGVQRGTIATGVYPGNDPGSCCWMGPRATLRTSVPFGADTLLVTVFVPDYASTKSGQALQVRIDGAAAQERCCFGAGMHELAFRLPRVVQEHPDIVVHLAARSTFVPKERGLNGDTRQLSMLLRGIEYLDSKTGQRVDPSPLRALQSAQMLWLVVAGVGILALTLRRPVFGAAALLLTDPFLLAHPFHGTTITLPKVALVAVAIGIATRLPRIACGAGGGPALWLLLGAQLLFVASMAASSVHAAGHGAALRETLKALEYAATIAAAYIAYRLDPDEGIIRIAISVAAILVTVLALAQEFVGAPEGEMIAGHAIARIAGPLEGPNQLAGYLGVVVPAMAAFAVWRPALILERAAIVLGCIACLLTLSKAGIGALALALVVLFAVRYLPQWRALTAAGAGVLCTLLFGLAVCAFAGTLHGPATHIFGSANSADRFNGGLGVRSDLWHGAYALWRLHPVSGVGPGNYELEIGRYYPGVHTHANSMYFQALAEQGAAGFIAMLAVVAASIGVFVRRLNQPLALGACMAALAMAFHQIFDCMWVYPKVGVMWWLLLALGAAAVDLSRATENVAERAVA